MAKRIRMSRVIHTYITVVPAQEEKLSKTKQGRPWVYLGDPSHPQTHFDLTPTHRREGLDRILLGFERYLQADALPGYDQL